MTTIAGLDAWWLLVVILATYRAARIATVDKIAEPWIAGLYAWAYIDHGPDTEPEPRAGAWRTWAYELFTCPYCLGVWIAAGFYGIARWGNPTGDGLLVVLAIAGGQCFLQSRHTED